MSLWRRSGSAWIVAGSAVGCTIFSVGRNVTLLDETVAGLEGAETCQGEEVFELTYPQRVLVEQAAVLASEKAPKTNGSIASQRLWVEVSPCGSVLNVHQEQNRIRVPAAFLREVFGSGNEITQAKALNFAFAHEVAHQVDRKCQGASYECKASIECEGRADELALSWGHEDSADSLLLISNAWMSASDHTSEPSTKVERCVLAAESAYRSAVVGQKTRASWTEGVDGMASRRLRAISTRETANTRKLALSLAAECDKLLPVEADGCFRRRIADVQQALQSEPEFDQPLPASAFISDKRLFVDDATWAIQFEGGTIVPFDSTYGQAKPGWTAAAFFLTEPAYDANGAGFHFAGGRYLATSDAGRAWVGWLNPSIMARFLPLVTPQIALGLRLNGGWLWEFPEGDLRQRNHPSAGAGAFADWALQPRLHLYVASDYSLAGWKQGLQRQAVTVQTGIGLHFGRESE